MASATGRFAAGEGPGAGVVHPRRSALLDLVMDRGRVEVNELSDLFGVSRVTIRKDLEWLSEQGLLHREHGYAVASSTDDIAGRLAYHRPVKRRIAHAAAALVPDGVTVLIESGSVCALLAEALARADRGITIVTNSVFIAGYLRPIATADVVLLGGSFQARSEVTVGPLVAEAASHYYVDQLFVGVDGYAPEVGFMAKDALRADAVRSMAKQARNLVLVTESTKFTSPGAVRLAATGDVATLVTDDRIPEAVRDSLRAEGVDVVVVPWAEPFGLVVGDERP